MAVYIWLLLADISVRQTECFLGLVEVPVFVDPVIAAAAAAAAATTIILLRLDLNEGRRPAKWLTKHTKIPN